MSKEDKMAEYSHWDLCPLLQLCTLIVIWPRVGRCDQISIHSGRARRTSSRSFPTKASVANLTGVLAGPWMTQAVAASLKNLPSISEDPAVLYTTYRQLHEMPFL